MAKIKFGMMMTDASGKLGGHVFSKNKGGSYVRTKATPTNPQTAAQMSVRSIFAQITSGWSALTEAQRASFRNAVDSFKKTDVFGDLKAPTGKQLYQRLNQNLALVNQALLQSAPQPEQIEIPTGLTPIASILAEEFDLAMAGDTSNSQVMIFATAPLSQGTKYVKNKLRLLTTEAGANPFGTDIFAAYTAKYGALTAGDNIYIGIRTINASGQASPMVTAKATINA